MNQRLTDSRLANVGAETIRNAYVTFAEQFRAITIRAKSRYERQDWSGLQVDATDRLVLYRRIIDLIEAVIRDLLGDRLDNKHVWSAMKAVYSGLIMERDDWELAESFFNSVTRRIFTTVGVDHQIEFVSSDFETPPTRSSLPVYRRYNNAGSIESLIRSVLQDFRFASPYRELSEEVALVSDRVNRHLVGLGENVSVERLELVRSPFFRGMGAYLIGRLFCGKHRIPFALALHHAPGGIVVDAVLLDEDSVSILFSFAHSYFHVDVARPYDLVQFLKTILPRKRTGELYISLGYHKHGKTELYRDLLEHLTRTTQQFEIARGQRGMVMLVFTMSNYDMVFKVIKDHFNYPKESTRKQVMAKYDLVYRKDRAGRLVDAQAFEYLKFDRSLFAPELLAELQDNCGQSVQVDEASVVITHSYIQRRVAPLDVYIREVDEGRACSAVRDYGQAIKDMAATNIFPGDMMLKNFGVTRHGRVVFYDYDELCLLEDCNFRRLPPTDRYEEILTSEPWFHVNADDVFPEEFPNFVGLKGQLRQEFEQAHADLFTLAYWLGRQEAIRSGDPVHIFPYEADQRLRSEQPVPVGQP